MASVLSSTVARVFLGEAPAFTVPEYELRSAAGMQVSYISKCSVSSPFIVSLTRLFGVGENKAEDQKDRKMHQQLSTSRMLGQKLA